MAATFAFRASQAGRFHSDAIPGAFDEALVEMTADSNYPAGGYPFGTAQLQALSGGAFSTLESVEVVNPVFVSNTGVPQNFLAAWDKVNGKVHILSLAAAPAVELATASGAAAGFTCTLKVRFN
jgi:hypothetical protein